MTCSTCASRWLGNKQRGIARWHCRKQDDIKLAVLIGDGTKEDLEKAKGCRDWKK